MRSFLKGDREAVIRALDHADEKDALIDAAIEWQLMEDLEPKYKKEIKDYETTIERTLNRISVDPFGRMLLSQINPSAKVWIIPADWTKPTATTECVTERQGGGIRIHFNPKAFKRITISPRATANEVEDTLFHELVHAMRMSAQRFARKPLENTDFGNSEEFIATQLENVYHSIRRESALYSTYNGAYLTQNDMYIYLIADPQLVSALKFFLDTEPLAQNAATFRGPAYNPFRDFKEIETKCLHL
ncbi:MAG TPA: M91 family zinc metallopeptidase, partial [Pyrinomonadaceae bacterium]|nr:M91 family zinc metallopeptidase [Pyrinomonadaceae bacterium]